MNADSSHSVSSFRDRVTGASFRTTMLICLLLMLVGGALVLFIYATQPEAEREAAVRETAMLVSVTRPEAGTFRPTIVATGVVRPAREVTLRPRVNGQVAELSSQFVPGGYVEAGETLVRLDESDYRNTLRQRESELAQAQADLAIEKGRQDVAQRDYEQTGRELSEDNRALVLREPQRNRVEAQIASARAAVEQARLDLDRTRLTAPFDAHVVSRAVNQGSQVSAGDELGRLVGVDTYWVEATLPVSRLGRLAFPGDDEETGSAVEIRSPAAWQAGTSRRGHLFRLIGELDEQTRMARVLVSVDDPHARQSDSEDTPRLMIGAYVECRIQGRPIRDVVRVRRDYIRNNDTIWLMRDERLVINEVDIVFADDEYAYIRDGVRADDRVVTTHLATVEDGVRLRLEGEGDGTEEASRR